MKKGLARLQINSPVYKYFSSFCYSFSFEGTTLANSSLPCIKRGIMAALAKKRFSFIYISVLIYFLRDFFPRVCVFEIYSPSLYIAILLVSLCPPLEIPAFGKNDNLCKDASISVAYAVGFAGSITNS